eukprot:GHVS01034772.1.p1 GENE.GHVS01034772.1~~GHVS01034772.1.p1  ORF type:complete len:516 (-),score=86.03 GHVS01034772.1:436-1983(-)
MPPKRSWLVLAVRFGGCCCVLSSLMLFSFAVVKPTGSGMTSFLVSPLTGAVDRMMDMFRGGGNEQTADNDGEGDEAGPTTDRSRLKLSGVGEVHPVVMSSSTSEDVGSSEDIVDTNATRTDPRVNPRTEAMLRVRAIVADLGIREIPVMHNKPSFPPDFPAGTNKVLVARIVGNTMPPMQGKLQHVRNAEHIITNSPTQRSGEHRLWVVNRIVGESERNAFIQVMETYKEWYLEIPVELGPLEAILKEASVPEMKLSWIWQRATVCVTNQNAARNLVLKVADELGYDWSMVLDGNVYITSEGLDGAHVAMRRANVSEKSYVFLPFYRLVDDENSVMLTATATFDKLGPYLTGKQESQLVVGRNGKLGLNAFPVHIQYGANNKYSVVSRIANKKLHEPVCGRVHGAYKTDNESLAIDQGLVANCGYSVRLSYWSDPPENEKIGKALRKAVFDINSRGWLRQIGMGKLKSAILERVDIPPQTKQILTNSGGPKQSDDNNIGGAIPEEGREIQQQRQR